MAAGPDFQTRNYAYDARSTFMTIAATIAIHEASPGPSYYRAEQYDSDLGLYYLRARYYNPLTGRFLSRDPEDGALWLPITLHKYLYAGGNPTNWSDPRGRDIIEDTLIISRKSLSTVEYVNTIGCFANIVFAATTVLLAEEFDGYTAAGIAAGIYGCVTISASPVGNFLKLAKSAADLGACVTSGAVAIHDLNNYLEKPTAANEAAFVVDDIGFVLGCGITGIGAALEP
ncbi:RHS repeat-associated core domain-containing protein [Acidicapsa acidisoli]|uniref:RHS repeat-associated core domain-containing protein n=1 Tax=Acidicapsa acidisoli TaxID=1615681 RepID=UPI0021E01C4E|nr:RHS repeat-associated core domain-containing protein [Acidicapsa acidisoli]